MAANRAFAGTMVLGHFAQTDPVLLHPERAGLPPAHSDPAGSLPGDAGGAGSLDALEWAGRTLERRANPVLVRLA
jgi:hypothetical protein